MEQTSKRIIVAFVTAGIALLVFNYYFDIGIRPKLRTSELATSNETEITTEKSGAHYSQADILPEEGVELPVEWKDLGKQMVEAGVIDKAKIEDLYLQRGGLSAEDKVLLYSGSNGKIKITEKNSNLILNMFWALGLANKNEILTKGEMADMRYGGAGNFASTGGWTLSDGNPMNHYSKHNLISLTPEQQALVDKVSGGIYRPCCGNATHFPDCNHGMAMLGLLELMASQGVGEEEMYKIALKVNSYWFPENYVNIAKYFGNRGVAWADINAKTVLGSSYSSGQGYKRILSEIEPEKAKGGGGCSA